jgi:ABC-type sugar transport system permease subunit
MANADLSDSKTSPDFKDQTFIAALKNTLFYSFVTAIINSILGTILAFILLAKFRGKKFVRYLVLLPWTIPIALTIQAWKWMFHPQYSVLNWLGKHTHIITAQYGIQWLGQPKPAMASIIIVNVWRNFLSRQSSCLPAPRYRRTSLMPRRLTERTGLHGIGRSSCR